MTTLMGDQNTMQASTQGGGQQDGPRELPSKGPQLAMIYATVDLGLQPGYGKFPAPKRKVVVLFELEEKIKNGKFAGKPFGVNKIETNTANEMGRLYNDILKPLNVIPKIGANLDDLLVGKLCQVNIDHKDRSDKGKNPIAVVTNVAPARATDQAWELYNGRHVPGWKYPRWIQRMRDKALEPPEDAGCEWEPIDDDNRAPNVMNQQDQPQSQPENQNPPQPQQQQPQQTSPSENDIDGKIPF